MATRKKPSIFECDFCDMIFDCANSLKIHVRALTRSRYECPLCQYVACTKPGMTSHCKISHNEIPSYHQDNLVKVGWCKIDKPPVIPLEKLFDYLKKELEIPEVKTEEVDDVNDVTDEVATLVKPEEIFDDFKIEPDENDPLLQSDHEENDHENNDFEQNDVQQNDEDQREIEQTYFEENELDYVLGDHQLSNHESSDDEKNDGRQNDHEQNDHVQNDSITEATLIPVEAEIEIEEGIDFNEIIPDSESFSEEYDKVKTPNKKRTQSKKSDSKAFQPKKFPCDYCDLKFHAKFYLKRHTKAAGYSKTKYKCPECDFESCVKIGITWHIKKNHLENSTEIEHHQTYECDICDMKFKNLSLLNFHKGRSSKYKYYCPVCHFTSCTPFGLKNHVA